MRGGEWARRLGPHEPVDLVGLAHPSSGSGTPLPNGRVCRSSGRSRRCELASSWTLHAYLCSRLRPLFLLSRMLATAAGAVVGAAVRRFLMIVPLHPFLFREVQVASNLIRGRFGVVLGCQKTAGDLLDGERGNVEQSFHGNYQVFVLDVGNA